MTNQTERAAALAVKWKADPSLVDGGVFLMSRREKIEGIAVISNYSFPLASLADIMTASSYAAVLSKSVAIQFSDGSILKLEPDSFTVDMLQLYPKGIKDSVSYIALEAPKTT